MSDEVIGSSSVSGNPADTGSLTFDGFETYSAVLDTETFENRVTKVIVSPNKTITIYGMQSETIVRIFDMLGKEVLKQKISAEQNSIQASYLRSGVYIVKLNTANSSETKKIIVN